MAGEQVVVVGSANVDLTVRVERLPAPGETVLGRDLLRNAGGKGANQAIAAARAGAAVSFVGAVGADPDGELLRRCLLDDGIDCSQLRTVERPTGMAMIAVDGGGENVIVVNPGANLAVDAAAVDDARDLLASAPVTLTQLEIAPSALTSILHRGRLVVLNPAPVRPLAPAELQVHVCVPNGPELAALLGGRPPTTPDEAVAAARQLRGPAAVVVTLGALGAVVVQGDRAERVPAAEDVTVVDTTAAGDTLCGYLAAALAEGATVVEATRLGVAAASLSVGRAGASASIPLRGALGGPGGRRAP